MSFYVFSGSDRAKIQEKIRKILGEEYEVFEGADLDSTKLMEICASASLFAMERKVLIKDLTPARRGTGDASRSGDAEFEPYETLKKYADSPHKIVIWETNLSRKKSFREFCKLSQAKQEKVDAAETVDRFAIFKIFDKALVDGVGAAKEYRALNTDPYLAVGALASWALNKYKFRGGAREAQIVREVAELDMQTKTLKVAPELLIESLIARGLK